MKSKISWVRRAQRAIRMVSELHRMGYQHLRIMPYEHPNAWRLAVGPREHFSSVNGASLKNGSWDGVPVYSSAGGGGYYFDWEDAQTDDARALAEKFVLRFPDVVKRGLGRDWAYAGWLSELVGFLENGDLLPVTLWEYMKGTPDELRFLPIWSMAGGNTVSVAHGVASFYTVPSPNVKQFPLPPSAGETDSED